MDKWRNLYKNYLVLYSKFYYTLKMVCKYHDCYWTIKISRVSPLTSSDTLSVLYLSSQYCVHILYSCCTLSTCILPQQNAIYIIFPCLQPVPIRHPCAHTCARAKTGREGGREGERQREEHTGHRSLTISSYEILNFLNMTYTTTEICKSSSSTRNVKYKHPSHIIINKKASWKETKVRLPLCNLVGWIFTYPMRFLKCLWKDTTLSKRT